MISSNVKRQVAREANLLKKYATKEELERIKISRLNPFDSNNCIYGQMTGDCYGRRATELIAKCAVPVGAKISRSFREAFRHPSYMWVKRAWQFIGLGDVFRNPYDNQHTAIEYYITQKGAKNRNLINYLKGRTEVLDI